MKGQINKILAENGVFEWAVCDFSAVALKLLPCRAAERLPEGAKSIIMIAFPYKVEDAAPKNISRYAAVPDYHDVVGEMLKNAAASLSRNFPQNKFAPFADNSPIPEVFAANVAGLGYLGRNGLLIHKKYGSFVFLGEIVTDLELIPDSGGENCLDCGRCISACSSVPNKETCLSAVTQRKGELSGDEIARIRSGGSCWGCDLCSEVCPMNEKAEETYIKEFTLGYRNSFSPTEDREGRAYNWRGKAVIERNYKIITEND